MPIIEGKIATSIDANKVVYLNEESVSSLSNETKQFDSIIELFDAKRNNPDGLWKYYWLYDHNEGLHVIIKKVVNAYQPGISHSEIAVLQENTLNWILEVIRSNLRKKFGTDLNASIEAVLQAMWKKQAMLLEWLESFKNIYEDCLGNLVIVEEMTPPKGVINFDKEIYKEYLITLYLRTRGTSPVLFANVIYEFLALLRNKQKPSIQHAANHVWSRVEIDANNRLKSYITKFIFSDEPNQAFWKGVQRRFVFLQDIMKFLTACWKAARRVEGVDKYTAAAKVGFEIASNLPEPE